MIGTDSLAGDVPASPTACRQPVNATCWHQAASVSAGRQPHCNPHTALRSSASHGLVGPDPVTARTNRPSKIAGTATPDTSASPRSGPSRAAICAGRFAATLRACFRPSADSCARGRAGLEGCRAPTSLAVRKLRRRRSHRLDDASGDPCATGCWFDTGSKSSEGRSVATSRKARRSFSFASSARAWSLAQTASRTAVSPSRNRSFSLSDGMGSSWLGRGWGQTWSVGMIHSSPMAVWRGRVTM